CLQQCAVAFQHGGTEHLANGIESIGRAHPSWIGRENQIAKRVVVEKGGGVEVVPSLRLYPGAVLFGPAAPASLLRFSPRAIVIAEDEIFRAGARAITPNQFSIGIVVGIIPGQELALARLIDFLQGGPPHRVVAESVLSPR